MLEKCTEGNLQSLAIWERRKIAECLKGFRVSFEEQLHPTAPVLRCTERQWGGTLELSPSAAIMNLLVTGHSRQSMPSAHLALCYWLGFPVSQWRRLKHTILPLTVWIIKQLGEKEETGERGRMNIKSGGWGGNVKAWEICLGSRALFLQRKFWYSWFSQITTNMLVEHIKVTNHIYVSYLTWEV